MSTKTTITIILLVCVIQGVSIFSVRKNVSRLEDKLTILNESVALQTGEISFLRGRIDELTPPNTNATLTAPKYPTNLVVGRWYEVWDDRDISDHSIRKFVEYNVAGEGEPLFEGNAGSSWVWQHIRELKVQPEFMGE